MQNLKNMFVLVLTCYLACAGDATAQYKITQQTTEMKAFPWPDNKRVAVSLTFDDARLSQIDKGLPLFNKYDVKATFYILPRRVKERLVAWKEAVAKGHEIGNHTVSHPCTGNYDFSINNALEDYTIEQMVQEMDQANQYIFDQLNVKPISFAYPCGQKFVGRGSAVQSYVPLVAEKFLTGRGWLGEHSNNPWICDFSQLLGVESDSKSFDELKTLIDQAAENGKWIIFAGHEINNDGTQITLIDSLEKLCQYVQDPANGIWIDTVGNVAEYISSVRERIEK